jgi:hypothetical protein
MYSKESILLEFVWDFKSIQDKPFFARYNKGFMKKTQELIA